MARDGFGPKWADGWQGQPRWGWDLVRLCPPQVETCGYSRSAPPGPFRGALILAPMGHVPALRAGMADARGAGAERSSAIHANSIDVPLPHENAERCSAQA